MFAVILLGIGFIMVAAMFPVAIGQSRTSTEETAASALARSAIAHLSQIATKETMPPSANKPALNAKLWDAMRGAMIDSTDPRYAWTAVYRRPVDSSTAQVYIFALQVRNHTAFNLNDLEVKTSATPGVVYPGSIQPKPIQVKQLRDAADKPVNAFAILDTVGDPMPAAAEGAYVILADHDPGQLLRLGNPINQTAGVWELAPGNDSIKTPIPKDQLVPAYMVGRGYNPNTPNNNLTGPPAFEGMAMDIAVFTGFVKVK